MDARSLAMEMTPIIMWQNDKRPEFYREFWDYHSKSSSAKSLNNTPPTYSAWDVLSGNWVNPCCLIACLLCTSI